VKNNALLMIYCSIFHAVMTNGIIVWGNSCHTIKVFRLQKGAIGIIMGCGRRESCRNVFKKLKILPLMSQHMFALLIYD
jgi:hypothetical protein